MSAKLQSVEPVCELTAQHMEDGQVAEVLSVDGGARYRGRVVQMVDIRRDGGGRLVSIGLGSGNSWIFNLSTIKVRLLRDGETIEIINSILKV